MLGMVFVEKLLRTTKVRRIYALVRAPAGHAQKRLENCWARHLPFACQAMKASRRVHALEGDVAIPEFGFTSIEREMLRREASIVIHMAADISLVKTLSQLASVNVFGTLALASFAKTFDRLERYVHVSTLFSQMHLQTAIEEPVASVTTEDEFQAVRNGRTLFPIEDKFAFNYAYTKNLAERLLEAYHSNLPLMMYRPSIIGPA